jgi:hypothetical protein
VNADLRRHTQKQKDLELRIAEAEVAVAVNPSDEFAESVLRTYRELLNQLNDSKANVVAKIGRK